MKPGGSSLNPYAASYVPLSKRVAERGTGTSVSEKDPNNHYQHLFDSGNCASEKIAEDFQVKINLASSSHGSSSQSVTELTDNQFPDEDPDMDIEFLRMKFPGICEQSLRDVYEVNDGDLDAAIDMLTQLEFDGVESSRSLPETLDIGDVSESGLSVDSTSSKLKNVAAEASTSSNLSANVS